MLSNLDVIPAVGSLFSLLLAPVARIVWRSARRRSLRRNEDGQCASCGLAWSDIGIAIHEYLIDGARVCAPCARRLRRRTIVVYATLVTGTALVSGITYSALINHWRWTPWWALVWLASPPLLLASATALAVRRMKLRNRDSMLGGPPGGVEPPRSTGELLDAATRPSKDQHLQALAPAIS